MKKQTCMEVIYTQTRSVWRTHTTCLLSTMANFVNSNDRYNDTTCNYEKAHANLHEYDICKQPA